MKMMPFPLEESAERAEARFREAKKRRSRADRGVTRLPGAVVERARGLMLGMEKPELTQLHQDLGEFCTAHSLAAPSRPTLYNLMLRIEGHRYRIPDLPKDIQDVLYNLAPEQDIPGRQLAFYCVNYGGSREMAFAAALPWLDVYQASHMRGYRRKSRGVIDAICRVRGIR